MTAIFQTNNFSIETPSEKPHVSRSDGGHIVIAPKIRVGDVTKLTPPLAIELMKLTMVTGEAMKAVMNQRGVDIGIINYQENGNWGVFVPGGPHLHVHLYGRAMSARTQKYGDALYFPKLETGFYDKNDPLTQEDISAIKSEIERLLQTEKYKSF